MADRVTTVRLRVKVSQRKPVPAPSTGWLRVANSGTPGRWFPSGRATGTGYGADQAVMKHGPGWCNGSTPGFGPGDKGSIPFPGAHNDGPERPDSAVLRDGRRPTAEQRAYIENEPARKDPMSTLTCVAWCKETKPGDESEPYVCADCQKRLNAVALLAGDNR